jgi:hypothetical protein
MAKQIPTRAPLAVTTFALKIAAEVQRVQWVSPTVDKTMQQAGPPVAICTLKAIILSTSMDMSPEAQRMHMEDHFAQSCAMPRLIAAAMAQSRPMTTRRMAAHVRALVVSLAAIVELHLATPQSSNVVALTTSRSNDVSHGRRQCVQRKEWMLNCPPAAPLVIWTRSLTARATMTTGMEIVD